MADGDNMVLGGANDSDGSTSITRSGTVSNTALVVSNDNGSAVKGEAALAGGGVTGISGTGLGVHGRADDGVGVFGEAGMGPGDTVGVGGSVSVVLPARVTVCLVSPAAAGPGWRDAATPASG
jgi:hypothetical protein